MVNQEMQRSRIGDFGNSPFCRHDVESVYWTMVGGSHPDDDTTSLHLGIEAHIRASYPSQPACHF